MKTKLLILLSILLIGCTKTEFIIEEEVIHDTVFISKQTLSDTLQPDSIKNITILEVRDSVQDNEGNWYKKIQIGEQIWLAENLRTKHYNNGDEILTTEGNLLAMVQPKYWFKHKQSTNLRCDGLNYTWYAIKDYRGLCPPGYRIADVYDYQIMEKYLAKNGYGNYINENNVSKSISSKTGWMFYHVPTAVGYEPDKNNTAGFNAVPCGNISVQSGGMSHDNYTAAATYWTNTPANDQMDYRAMIIRIRYNLSWIEYSHYPKDWTFPVRCIKN